MKRLKKVLSIVLIAVFLTGFLPNLNLPGFTIVTEAEAAIKDPVLKENNAALFIGNGSYKIKISNTTISSIITYSSKNSNVATVSTTGAVTPKSVGTALIEINVKQNKKTYKLTLNATVKEPYIDITKSTNSLKTDETYQFEATTYGIDGQISWGISDSSIASIDIQGKFTAYKQGKVIVYAKAGNKSAECSVEISPNNLINNSNNQNGSNSGSLSVADIYDKCSPSAVEISVTDTYGLDSLGSGFFIDKDTVVTNYHVIEGAKKIQVTTYDKVVHDVDTIIGYDEKLDIAILEVKADCQPLTISQRKSRTGEEVYALGSPLGLTGTITKGMITTASRTIEDVDYIQTDAALSPGNSGGPLLNTYGEVIGINTMYYPDGQNLNFSINIDAIEKVYTGRPILVSDYITNYQNNFLANMAYKVDTFSVNKYNPPQLIDAYKGVKGNFDKRSFDEYCFYVGVAGWKYLIISVTDSSEYSISNVDVSIDYGFLTSYNPSGKVVDSYKIVSYYLTPGYYTVRISTNYLDNSKTQSYSFFIK